MYPAVKSVVPTEDYMLSIAFDNGESGTLDMKPFLNFGVFRRLKDRSAFKRVRVSFDTIEWDSGNDLDTGAAFLQPEIFPVSLVAHQRPGPFFQLVFQRFEDRLPAGCILSGLALIEAYNK